MCQKKIMFGTTCIFVNLFFFWWLLMRDNSTEANIYFVGKTDLQHPTGETNERFIKNGCNKRTSLFFLKMHKCGSSTVQNILMRFGRSHQLDFVLPELSNYLGNPERFSSGMIGPKVALSDGEKYDIFTHPTRYKHTAIKEVMKKGTAFITIMREPISLQISLYNYYKFYKIHNSSLTDLLHLESDVLQNIPRLWQKFGWNQMAWDLGVSSQEIKLPNVVPQLINKIEAEFDLIMITEYMEASLILLADLMCWPLEEVRFLSLNVASTYSTNYEENKYRTESLTIQERDTLQELNIVDVNIYDHFKKRFKDCILNYGVGRMYSQIRRLFALNYKLFSECVAEVKTSNNMILNSNVYKYVLKPNASVLCEEVISDELEFTIKLRREQENKISVLNNLRKFLQE